MCFRCTDGNLKFETGKGRQECRDVCVNIHPRRTPGDEEGSLPEGNSKHATGTKGSRVDGSTKGRDSLRVHRVVRSGPRTGLLG